MAGLTAAGFEIPSLQEILADIVAEQKAQIDADINTSTDSVVGQLNGIFAAKLLELWELAQQVYGAAYPDTATGTALSHVANISGTVRRPATKATLSARLIGTVATVIPLGSEVYVDGDTASRFVTTASATIEEHGATDYVDVTLQAATAGTATKAFLATDTLVIATPVSGWASATILADYVAGTDEESDTALRVRRLTELATAGTGPLDALRADILLLNEGLTTPVVTSCSVLENTTTDPSDANGLPIWNIEVVVGTILTDAEVAAAIWGSKPAGTGTFGAESYTLTDDSGNSQTVNWSTPTEKPVYIDITLDTTAATYVGDAAVKEALKEFGDTLVLGEDVVRNAFIATVMDLAGVNDVTLFELDFVASPSATANLAVGAREVATFNTANITIV